MTRQGGPPGSQPTQGKAFVTAERFGLSARQVLGWFGAGFCRVSGAGWLGIPLGFILFCWCWVYQAQACCLQFVLHLFPLVVGDVPVLEGLLERMGSYRWTGARQIICNEFHLQPPSAFGVPFLRFLLGSTIRPYVMFHRIHSQEEFGAHCELRVPGKCKSEKSLSSTVRTPCSVGFIRT